MKFLQKLHYLLAVLLVSGLFSMSPATVFAGTGGNTTKTWSGAGDGTKFSDPLNWVNGVAPVSGDSLIFDTNTFTFNGASTPLNDDLPAGTVFDSIITQGTSTTSYSVDITGNDMVIGSAIKNIMTNNGASLLVIENNITLGGNTTIATGGQYNQAIRIGYQGGSLPITLNNAGYNLTIGTGTESTLNPTPVTILSNISGSGGINVLGGSLGLAGDNTFGGNVTVASGANVVGYHQTSFGDTTGTTTVAAGGGLGICTQNGNFSTSHDYTTIGESFTIGGSGTGVSMVPVGLAVDKCEPNGYAYPPGYLNYTATSTPAYSNEGLTFTGTVTLSADTTFKAFANFYGSGNLITFNNLALAGHQFTQADGSAAQVSYGGTTYPLPPVQANTLSSLTSDLHIWAREADTVANNTGVYNVQVDRGAEFIGTGNFGNVSAENLATISSGQTPGCMTYTGFNLDGTLTEKVQGKTTACSDYDQLAVNGTVTLGANAKLDLSLLNSYVPQVGDSFVVVSNDGTDPVSGTFNGLPEGATFGDNSNSYNFTISYVGGDGNDIVVTRAAGAPSTGFKSHRIQLLASYSGVVVAAAVTFIGSRLALRKQVRR